MKNRIEALALVSDLLSSKDIFRKSLGAEIKELLELVVFIEEIQKEEEEHAPWCNLNCDCNCKD